MSIAGNTVVLVKTPWGIVPDWSPFRSRVRNVCVPPQHPCRGPGDQSCYSGHSYNLRLRLEPSQ